MGLGKEDAVNLLHGLVYAELARLKIHGSVSVPFEIDVADGGIDGTLTGIESDPLSELLFADSTYYQSKSGSSVSIAEGGLKDIVLEDTTPKEDRNLKPKIREIAEKNGNLVLWLPGISKPNLPTAETKLLEIIKGFVPETTLTVKILQADQIVGLLKPHIALTMQLMRGSVNFQGIPFESWASEKAMSNHFEHDERRDQVIENIRTLLLADDSVEHDIRVSGFPGNGKTRSVLAALDTPELSSQVIYFARPSDALESGNLAEIGIKDDLEGIVVVDECDAVSYSRVNNIIKRSRSPLKLVTIFNEDGSSIQGDMSYVDLNTSEKLSDEAIKKIIESYSIANDDAGRWAEFCNGSPRMAHMIGGNLQYNSSVLRNPSYDAAMDLCIANRDRIDSEEFNTRRNVLMWLSLFTKFGWSTEFASERKFIISKIMQKEGLPEGTIEDVIRVLKDRKIIQGDKTLYISPLLLQVWAWKWWWDKYSGSFSMDQFWEQKDESGNDIEPSEDLRGWFNDMFQYAAEVPGAAEVVKTLLGTGGPLEKEEQLVAAIGSRFFLHLTEANPGDALALVSRWLDKKSDDELEKLDFDRQRLVNALEAMAVWKEYFVEATRLLLRLARTENNHTYSNNSEGTFSDMFSNGWGKVAPTEAPPSERIIILKEALDSDNPREHLLAVNAIYKSLETDHFSKFSGAETQGLKREPNLWKPETYGEFWEAMVATWNLLIENTSKLSGEAKDKAVDLLTHRLRGLLRIPKHNLNFLNDFISLTKSGFIPYEDALKSALLILKYEKKLDKEVLKRMSEFVVELEGDDFSGKLKRYVATNVMEDRYDDEGKESGAAQKALDSLGEEAAKDFNKISQNPWLFTHAAKNGYSFGVCLAKADKDFSLIESLIEEQKKAVTEEASVFFLSGYMLEVQRRDIKLRDRILDRLKSDPYFKNQIAELIWRTELDEHTGDIIYELLQNDTVDFKELSRFKLGAATKNISDELFIKWIENLLSRNSVEAHAIAVDLFMSHFVFDKQKQLPEKLTLQLLTMKTLGSQANRQISNDIEWDWSQTAKRFIEQYPENLEPLIVFMANYYGRKNSIFESHHESATVLSDLARLKPELVWKTVASEIAKGSYGTYSLESWLHGEVSFDTGVGHGAIQLLDKKMVLDWIDEDPKVRASMVARMVPHDFGFDNKPGEHTWIRIVLDKYGDDESVRHAVNANLWSTGWSGPASLHYAARLEDAKRFKELNKDSKNVQKWANEYIPGLEKQVNDSKLSEERYGH